MDKHIQTTDNKIAIITGANVGLGFETTFALAAKGIRVIMACRNPEKGEAAKLKVLEKLPDAVIDVMQVDLSKMSSVESFASRFILRFRNLDLLINNAGVMMPPYQLTEDGFESQLATNYLGHFTLTGLLLPLLLNTVNSRVISVSSLAHRWSNIQFNDLNFQKGYSKRKAYGQSKLACLMFAYELDRRLKKAGAKTISIAAHPGLSDTSLARHMPSFLQWLSPLLGQTPESGAQPLIYAALSSELQGGEYIGPDGFSEWHGKPTLVKSNDYSYDTSVAQQLWEISEKLTQLHFEFHS